jgi:DNA primase
MVRVARTWQSRRSTGVISPETIAQVRDRTDILAVIQESVPTLKRRGRSFVGLCPFHKEKTPSFHVNPDRGFFHCFGCKESGSVIDFVMKLEGATFPEAVRSLAERAGIVVEEDRNQVEPSVQDRLRKQKEDLYNANSVAAHYWEEQLRTHPLRQYALDELARRGLVPGQSAQIDDALQAFRIGYAPPGWDGLTSYFRAQGISPIAGESVGLLVPRSSGSGHYDRFRHRLMFAVTDPQGRVVAFSGRALEDPPDAPPREAGDRVAKYINSPESPIYTKGQMLFGLYQARHAIRQHEQALLVEGNFDVVSLHARGLQHVVAPLGTAFTVEQAKLLKRFAGQVIFMFDGDAAGKKAVRLSREPVREAGLMAKVAILPEGLDPDELVRTRGVEGLEGVIANARGMLEYLLDTALDASFASADAYERAARVSEVAKILASEDDPLIRSMAKGYADQLAGRLDVVSPDAFRALEQTVRKALATAGPRPVAGPNASPRDARVKGVPAGSPERREIVGALIEYPSLLNDQAVADILPLLEGNSAQIIAALAQSLIEPLASAKSEGRLEKALDTSVFLEQIPAMFRGFAEQRLAAPTLASRDDARGHLLENANKLKRAVLSRETSDLAREQHERAGDWDAERALAKQAEERMRMKHGVVTKTVAGDRDRGDGS